MMVAKLGDLLRSKHYHHINKIIEIQADQFAVWECVEEGLISYIKLGRRFTGVNLWEESAWEIIPSKSENFRSLYEKLSNG